MCVLHLRMHACMYVCVCMYVRVSEKLSWTYIYLLRLYSLNLTCKYMYVCMFVCMYVCMHVYVYVCMYVCILIKYIHIYSYICMYRYIKIYLDVDMYVCMYVCVCRRPCQVMISSWPH